VARLVWGVEDLVIEDGEVEGETKADWVGWSKVSLGHFGGVLVCLEGLVGGGRSLVTERKLGEVAVVVALPVVMY
jgi:hypothetical protein